MVKDIQSMCGFSHFIDQNWEYDIISFFWKMHKLSSQLEFLLFIMITWQVWEATNIHFQNKSWPTAIKVVDNAIRWLNDFNVVVRQKSQCQTNIIDDGIWKPLDKGIFLINVDAATNSRSNSCGLGIIIKDSASEFFLCKGYSLALSYLS